jgi:glycosyltransferase involved in cell wall biosynthesis
MEILRKGLVSFARFRQQQDGRMKILLSIYACAPNRGSDHAVGWNWAAEAHRLGHTVWALVSPAHRESIKRACDENPDLDGIHWIFPEVKGWPLKQAIEPKWERTYNLLWQRAALPVARDLHRQVGFDLVHHLTWAGIRAPTFLGALSAPLVIGPVGGGETSPPSLRDRIGLKGRILESIRDLSNSTIAMNPAVRDGLARASVIFVSTTDTQNLFRGALRDKTQVFTQLGLPELPSDHLPRSRSGPPRLLYAGRLLYWKGVHIALQAFAEVVRQIPDARFAIVGSGPERSRLEDDARQNNLLGSVEFIPQLPQNALFELYRNHDLFLFPSLHDSGGFVVLEALSHGLPVVCLDLGGPRDMVTPSSGVVVKNNGQNSAQLAATMAADICRLLASPETLAALSAGAVARAQDFILAQRIKRLYDCAMEFVPRNDTRVVRRLDQALSISQ